MLHGTIKFFGIDSSGSLVGYVYLDNGRSIAMDKHSVSGPVRALMGQGKRITFDVSTASGRALVVNATLAR